MIISGGQTGADRGGLDGAVMAGMKTGGTAPANFETEDGPDSFLPHLGLVEDEPRPGNSKWVVRTILNVQNSDATVIFGDTKSVGSKQTIKACVDNEKPWIANPSAEQLGDFCLRHEVKTLNVAGNRASKDSTIRERVALIVMDAIAFERKGEFIATPSIPRQDDSSS